MDIKIRVKNEEHIKAIQERLFELGCRWSNYFRCIGITANTENLFLFVNGHRNVITYGTTQSYFDSHEYKEVTLDDLYDMSVVENIPEYTMEELVKKIGNFKLVKKDD